MLRKVLLTAAVLGMFSAVLTGCRVEGEVGDAATAIVQPR